MFVVGCVNAVPWSGPAAAAAHVSDADVLGHPPLQQLHHQPGAHGAVCLQAQTALGVNTLGPSPTAAAYTLLSEQNGWTVSVLLAEDELKLSKPR